LYNPEERRREILLGALKIFERDGYYKARVSDIAIAANIGKGTIYQYFDSKISLFREMVKFCITEYLEDLKKSIEREKNPVKKLEIYIETEKEMMSKYGNIANIFIQEGDKIGKEVKEIILEARKEKLSIIKGTIKAGIEQGLFKRVNIDIFSMIFLGGIHQIIASELVFCGDRLDCSVDYDEVIDLLMDGIGIKNETV